MPGSLETHGAELRVGRPGHRHGTTLLEIAVCVVIVGLAITGLMEFMASGTRASRKAMDASVGLNLVRSGREWAATQDYATLKALCATKRVYSPVIGGQGDAMPGYAGWSQEFSAHQVSNTNLALDTTTPTDTLRVTVTAKRNNATVCNLDWLVVNQAAATQPAGIP